MGEAGAAMNLGSKKVTTAYTLTLHCDKTERRQTYDG
jgi:hypothetical protein